ncbi:insulinase family protein [Vreelandella nigrificans]|uniref:Peptidase M16 n=1 Tax=Vreelandella nigrificans TaxID=2042704 RepID=A0A2A4HJ92_9GAMM|nr:insulinase family protein [Halomonas nigrificans]PCF95458.1 peptidase M16 [Halomonas nigrificans]
MARLSFPQAYTSLPNGAQGVLAHAPHLARAHVSIAISAGYLDEPHALPGLAHLLEHVLSTAPLAASPNTSLLAWFTQHQGRLNARTDDYVTDVHFSIPVSKLAAAAITVAAQLANPRMPLPTIHAEVAAIDAEWQARQHSRQMQRLDALAALANPQHIGAGCRHGNAQTLGQDAEALLKMLTRFHRDHYHGGRVSIAMISSWPMEEMGSLAEHMAALFTPPPPQAPTLAITPRWGRLPNAKVRESNERGANNNVEYFWPLPSVTSYHQFSALINLADSLNQGHLAEQLPDSVTHYHATTAPAGATDSFSLQLSGALQPDAVLAPLTDQLNQCISGLGFDILRERGNAWQPPTDTVQLAPAWFAHARHQAVARRYATLPANHQPLAGSMFTIGNARWLIGDAPTAPAAATFDIKPTPPPTVQCWYGQYDVQADFNTLTDDAWAACFIPGAVIVPSPLIAQWLARQGMVFKQENSPRGSWVMVVGSRANHAMLALLEAATLALPAAQEGLLAQQLIQRLMSLPATPAVWVSHQAESGTITQAVADLVSRLPTYAGNISGGTPSAAGSHPASTAVMRTLRLPGTPVQRWLLAVAETHHSALFFQQARDKHRLGYVAAVRRGDGAPCSLGYVVQTQTNEDVGSIEETLKAITGALWQGTNSTQWKQPATPTAPETPLAALIIQWQSLLSGAVQPLHRLAWENLTPEAFTELLTQLNTFGRWQTHRLDSTGHYLVSD